ncbi:MAG TPA: hypothetical protein VMT85_09680 [Thermoanaerobaculia bacterium]|nr:hypothetical protein [Thermoanaerobaculia bacterium]
MIDFDATSLPRIDRDDFPSLLEHALAAGEISEDRADELRRFRAEGYLHVRSAIDPALLERLREDYEEAWRTVRTCAR